MTHGPQTLGLALFAFLALMGAAFAADTLFAQHMWVLFFVLSGSTIVMLRRSQPAAAAPRPDASGYLDGVVRYGSIATMFWGVIGLLVGVVVALQLAYPDIFNIEPGSTSAACVRCTRRRWFSPSAGNALIATSFYVVQRTSRARLFGGDSRLVRVLGLPALIVMAATATCSASPRGGNMRSPNGMSICADGRLGRVSRRLPRHDHPPQGTPHLRRELVLPVVHRDDRDAACREQPLDAGLLRRLEELLAVSRASRTR